MFTTKLKKRTLYLEERIASLENALLKKELMEVNEYFNPYNNKRRIETLEERLDEANRMIEGWGQGNRRNFDLLMEYLKLSIDESTDERVIKKNINKINK